MAQYKNYAGDLITCPKQEGTCWQPEHLTKEQMRIMVTKSRFVNNDPVPYNEVISGVAGDDSYVSADAYQMQMYNYGHQQPVGERPTHTAGAAMFDLAKLSLGDDTNVFVDVTPDEDGRKGWVTVATALRKDGGKEGYIDWVEYTYETNAGETKFFKKKMFGLKEITPIELQKDIAKSRNMFQREEDSRAANSG